MDKEYSFSEILNRIKQGHKVCRNGWNGKGLFVEMNNGGYHKFSELAPFLVIGNHQKKFNTWVPSISDLLANDWIDLDEKIEE